MKTLTAEEVDKLYKACIFSRDINEEPDSDVSIGVGLRNIYAFEPAKLKQHRARIALLLLELPPCFFKGTQSPASVTMGIFDKHYNEWGNAVDLEKLLALGSALNFVSYASPREEWVKYPGGYPLISISVGF